MGNAIKILPNYTYDDYVNWEGRWELLHGIPYAMAPLPAPYHQFIASNLSRVFGNALLNCEDCKVYQPIDYKVAEDIVVQPDLLIVCGNIKKKFLDFPPALVAEILSPATALKDRHTKFDIYERQQIRYYLIISQDNDEVEVYELVKGKYQLQKKGRDVPFSFSIGDDCKAEINFGDIW